MQNIYYTGTVSDSANRTQLEGYSNGSGAAGNVSDYLLAHQSSSNDVIVDATGNFQTTPSFGQGDAGIGLKRGSVVMDTDISMSVAMDSKKAKLVEGDGSRGSRGVPPPSRVIHIRNIPRDISEAEIVEFGAPFGKVTNILMARQKNMAFLEFESVDQGVALVSYYEHKSPILGNRVVFVSYSMHKVLDMHGRPSIDSTKMGFLQGVQTSAHSNAAQGRQVSCAGKVLIVIVENILYPVEVDTLHLIFSKSGPVARIMRSFSKQGPYQALIEYEQPEAAYAAKVHLDGQRIYNVCDGYILRIDYSNLPTLMVRHNDENNRDYTLDKSLPHSNPQPFLNPPMMGEGRYPPSMLPLLPPSHQFPGNSNAAAHGSNQSQQVFPGPGFDPESSRGGGPMMPPMPGSVLLVTNINVDKLNINAMFTLFGIYGDVQRIKILYEKRNNALVEMTNPTEAQSCINHLSGKSVFGSTIRVVQSKHPTITFNRPQAPDDSGDPILAKDFSGSTAHRFKIPSSRNQQNVYPPSSILHISNIPEGVTSDDIVAICKSFDLDIISFNFFKNTQKMGLARLESMEQGIEGVIALHNYPIKDKVSLKASFAKNNPHSF